MSIEAMYPSRCQSRSQNPLFWRTLRRKHVALMLAAISAGMCLTLLQLIPVTAHADAKTAAATQPAIPTASPIAPAAPQTGRTIRQIQIYSAANN